MGTISLNLPVRLSPHATADITFVEDASRLVVPTVTQTTETFITATGGSAPLMTKVETGVIYQSCDLPSSTGSASLARCIISFSADSGTLSAEPAGVATVTATLNHTALVPTVSSPVTLILLRNRY